MAITVKTQPPNYNPVYNRIEYCADSTNTAQPNFKYIFRVYVDAGTLIATFKVPPEPNVSDLGIQDVSRVLAAYIKEQPGIYNTTASFNYAQENPIRKFRVDIAEQWDVLGTPTEAEGSNVTGDDKYVWQASFKHHDWIDQINETSPFNTWLMNTTNGTSARFLTNVDNHYVSINDIGWLWCLTDAPADIDYVEVKTYDSSGTIIQTAQVANVLTTTADAARLVTVMAAPQSLNNYSGSFLSGSAPIITSSVASYTVQIFKTGGTAMSEVMDFTILEPCKFTQYRLHYLNELGGFDAFNFQAKADYTTSVTRKTYTRSANYFEGTGTIKYHHQDNGTSDYYVKSRESLKLRTDWITEAQMNDLRELIESPMVFLEFDNLKSENDFKPVYVKTTRWSEKLDSIDKLFKLEVDIDLGHENFRQRR